MDAQVVVLLTDTQRSLWWGAIIGGFVIVLAVAALLTILVLEVRTIERRVLTVKETLQAGQDQHRRHRADRRHRQGRRGGAGRGARAPPVPRPGPREGPLMTTLVVLSVVDIVLLIAGLAFYLFVVGGQLTRVATDLEECADIVWDIKRTPSRSSRASPTSTASAVSSPVRCRCSTAWPRGSWSARPTSPRRSGPPAAPASGTRRSRMHDMVGYSP